MSFFGIYQIDAQIASLIDENGEITDLDALDELDMAREQKLEDIVCLIKNLVAEAADIKSEEENLKERRGKVENSIEKIKAKLGDYLNGEKFETARCRVSWRHSVSTEISDPDACMEFLEAHEYDDCIKYAKPTISKEAIKKRLDAGEAIPGASLKEKLSAQIK